MRELPRSSKYVSTPDAPVTEEERASLTQQLNAAFESGAVGVDDYRPLLDRLYAARKLGELVPVVQALPPSPTHDVPAIVPVGTGRPGEVSPARPPRTALVAVTVGVGVVALILLLVLVLGLTF